MSVPSYSIRCTQCDYRSSSLATNGCYYYKDDDGEFNLEKQLGWCNGCQSITAIEDFSDTAKVASRIRSELESIRRDAGTVFANILNVLFKSRREWLDSTIEAINSYAKYIQLAQKRIGQERCLTCGSHVVRPYKPTREGGGFKDTGDFMFHGQHNTDIAHPGCGGMFYEKADNMRFSMVSYSKFYTTDGVFIESCLEKTKY
jgi:hypothetical protein